MPADSTLPAVRATRVLETPQLAFSQYLIEAVMKQSESSNSSTPLLLPPPVSRLPDDILRRIFKLVYNELVFEREMDQILPFASARSRLILPLTQACYSWRLVALSTPELWTEIEMSFPMFAPACFERSESLPLSITFNPTQVYLKQGQINPIFNGIFRGVLLLRAAQLGLTLKEEDIDAVFVTLRDTQWAQLNSLTLRHAYPNNRRGFPIAPQPETLMGDWNWNIHNMVLFTLSIPLSSSFFGQNLTSLTLVDCTDPRLADNLGILQFLQSHPQLEKLSISHQGLRGFLLKFREEGLPARFNHKKLRELILWDVMDITSARVLFDRLFTEAFLTMTLYVGSFEYNPFPSNHPIAQRIVHLDTILVTLASDQLQINDYASIQLSEFVYSLPECKANCKDKISIQPPHLSTSLSGSLLFQFAYAYRSHHCKHLVFTFWNSRPLEFDDRVDTETDWTALFKSFPNLESIHALLMEPAPAFEDLFIALEAFDTSKLQSISLEGVVDVGCCVEEYSRSLRKMHESGRGLKELRLLFRPRPGREEQTPLREESRLLLKPWVDELQMEYRAI